MYQEFLLSVVFLLLFFNLPHATAQSTVVTRNPYYNQYNYNYTGPHYNNTPHRKNYYKHGGYYSKNFIDLNAPEKYVLRKEYTENSKLKRLQRLERQVFGAVQQGNFDERYQNVREAIASQSPKHPQKSVLKRIGDYFAGQLTGFEPPFSNDFLYDSNYPAFNYQQGFESSSLYSGGTSPWNQEYRFNNNGIGNSGGVRIID